jgi:hypothetical protein
MLDKLAERFQKLMDDGVVKLMKDGFFTDSMEVGISVDSIKITSHLLHQICLNIQGSKHQKHVQDKFEWTIQLETVLIGRDSSLAFSHWVLSSE